MSDTHYCCPFCGLVCDDLSVDLPGCPRAVQLSTAPALGVARSNGSEVDTAAAVAAAAAILRGARRPLVAGLACDVTGHRAALDLAERTGAVVDHMNGAGQFRNWLAFQDGGWMSTTLSEVRNRADVVVLAGTDATAFPRFFERCLAPESQFGELSRRVIVLGDSHSFPPERLAGTALAIPIAKERLGELCAALRARLAGRLVAAGTVAGMAPEQLDALLATLRAARYGVLAWNAAELDFPDADLAVRAMADLVTDLNRVGRWAVLPLGGSDGDTSAAQVCTWRTGYPLRVGFEAGGPHYEPLSHETGRLLAMGGVDALLWISALDPERRPPETDCPVIVLGRPDMTFERPPAVFIPVAVPGLHHAGFLHRMDGVVALPLSARTATGLPAVAQALAAIAKELSRAQA
ncbi:hypothetical protein EZJ19_13595 [Parasulfuritortus cantonensis]|uniref:Formylmethanofuran dehydrogenase n=1 Tax=Parasulfuritortus cantonensis TaxID=2528202 RepID=A0A4R1B1L2_9PROT|nr:hypothetical protein [Parasulfuritortus cantonensis]TCJ11894.1 hypothetical protein EZJ19_13595 [Parasulfuritortus cantonensis]